MNSMALVSAAAAALLLSGAACAKDLLKQVDARGQIHYSERPLKGMRVLAVVDAREVAAAQSGASAAVPAPQVQAVAARRMEIDWSGERRRQAAPSLTSAYVELEAASAARDAAEGRLREAVVPLPGEVIRRTDGRLLRYLPAYFERIAPYEREAMMAQDRFERADVALAATR